ncbi:hypothetical protein [Methylibium rhizosphaerae]|uniref:hypothetical protein n=1 Tax=Methylibium rhizosphaerae TaxID=2570323 RepID=UPI0015E45C98|nr:hypothetical protein [Methylibium rhizosphaerae]
MFAMADLEVMVDRLLPDGRAVVINNSDEEVPLGTVFRSLQSRRTHREGDRFWQEPLAAAELVELEVSEIESWRHPVASLGRGHNAAFRFVGVGGELLQSHLEHREKFVYVFLCSLPPAV